jgi:hypothetical protein
VHPASDSLLIVRMVDHISRNEPVGLLMLIVHGAGNVAGAYACPSFDGVVASTLVANRYIPANDYCFP